MTATEIALAESERLERDVPEIDVVELETSTILGETELLQERAGAMGRTGERLGRLLAELQQLEEDVDRLALTLYLPGLAAQIRRDVQLEIDLATDVYNHLREAAVAAYRQLILQRESCGFRRHELVRRCYQIPELMIPPEEPVELVELVES